MGGDRSDAFFDPPTDYADVPIWDPSGTYYYSDDHDGFAHMSRHEIQIGISDQFAAEEMVINYVESRGVSQLEINGEVTATFATVPSPHFGTFADPLGFYGHCYHGNPQGRLAPLTFGSESAFAMIGLADHVDPVPIFEPGQAVIWFGPELEHPCLLAEVNEQQYVSLNTARSVPFEAFASANPETPKRYKDNAVIYRIVYRVGDQDAGAGQLKMQFSGQCCSSFNDLGAEQCS